ncbi:hypothetical protein PQX77_010360 [Marasmius sp. AFHP31]|nr:hypothetical protein PQX77_010360 [Marasmius sp. AFHP31]
MAFIGQGSSAMNWSPRRSSSNFTIAPSGSPSRQSTLVPGGSPLSEKEVHQQNMTRPPNIYEQEEEIKQRYPVPEHWKAASTGHFQVIRRALFNTLCMIAFGHAGLDPVWAHIKLEEEGEPDLRTACTERLCKLLDNMVMVVSFFTSNMALRY